LQDTVLDNVHTDAFARFDDPNPDWARIDNCGDTPCTMPQNLYVRLTGTTKTGAVQPTIPSSNSFLLIPDNSGLIGGFQSDGESTLTKNDAGNVWFVESTRLAQLTFESLDGDKDERTVGPISLVSLDDPISPAVDNEINAF